MASQYLTLAGSIQQLLLYLGKFGYIKGAVYYQNRPIKNVEIYVIDSNEKKVHSVLTPDAKGNYLAKDLLKGHVYHLFVVGKDGEKVITSEPLLYKAPSDVVDPSLVDGLPCKAPFAPEVYTPRPAPAYETDLIFDWIERQMLSTSIDEAGFSIWTDQQPGFGFSGTLTGGYSLPTGVDTADYRLRVLHVTDTDYPQGTQALSGGTFSVAVTTPGYVRLAIERISTGDFMAYSRFATNLPRSYELQADSPGYGTPFQNRCYTYDAALCLLAAVFDSREALADRLVDGLLAAQHPNGAFPFSLAHYFTTPGDLSPQIYRTGANAWVGYALAVFLANNPNSSKRVSVRNALSALATYLVTLEDQFGPTSGLLRGGSGRFVADVLEPGYQVPWFSTEHNVDLVFFWAELAKTTESRFSGRTPAGWVTTLKTAIPKLWMPEQSRFLQGLSDVTGTRDTSDALDCNSWGFCAMKKLEDQGRCHWTLLSRTEDYYKVTEQGVVGYKPYSDQFGYPGAVDTIWGEGTFGVALAYWKAGWYSRWWDTILSMLALQDADKTFRYAALRDSTYEISTDKSVASTAWYLLVRNHPDKLWS